MLVSMWVKTIKRSCTIWISYKYNVCLHHSIFVIFPFYLLFNFTFLILQQKLKEEREAKRAHLDERHFYILQTVADSLGLELTEVEDAILEGNQVGRVSPKSLMCRDCKNQCLYTGINMFNLASLFMLIILKASNVFT